MLHKLSFSNFFSFKDNVSVDFVVDKHAPDTDAYFSDAFENRISKIMTIVGANASGKTNLLKSLSFLKWFVVDSFSTLQPDQPISLNDKFKPFFFCEMEEPSAFEIVFGIENEIYKYNLELTSLRVLHENLEVKGETNRWNTIFTRDFDKQSNSYVFNLAKLDVPSDFEKLVRPNTSVLSAAKQINNLQVAKIARYFAKIQSNEVDEHIQFKNNFQALFKTAKFYNEHADIKAKVEKILQSFDLGISKFSIEEFDGGDNTKFYVPFTSHKQAGSEKESKLMMVDESSGTRNLFVLLKDIFSALETGNIVIFDELDNSLHPLMVPEIVSLFRSKIHNPKNAQLFFTSHNLQILSQLDKQQIVLVEKNDNVSEAWKLSEIEGVRTDENYLSNYLTGVYGGIPRF